MNQATENLQHCDVPNEHPLRTSTSPSYDASFSDNKIIFPFLPFEKNPFVYSFVMNAFNNAFLLFEILLHELMKLYSSFVFARSSSASKFSHVPHLAADMPIFTLL